MMRYRRALMVAVVATALCAERAGAAVPSIGPRVAEAARQLAGRISVSFRQVVPATRIEQRRQTERADVVAQAAPAELPIQPHRIQGQPFQFRLPPPAGA